MKTNVILDSGAFSADQQNTVVDVYQYIDFIKETKPDLYFNLDVIGDYVGTWNHQEIMEKQGLTPIPVFHVEDPWDCLSRCMGYDYMAIGGMASGVSEQARQRFLDRCWDVICDTPDNMPKCKVHGLGLASPMLVARYPWFSVDTASGIHYGRYGIIVIPVMDSKGDPDYFRPPYTIYVTERSTAQKVEGKHIKSVSVDLREWIYKYIESRGFEVGKTEVIPVPEKYELQANEKFTDKSHSVIERIVSEGVFSNGIIRDYFNLDFYLQMEDKLPKWPWPYKTRIRTMF